MLHSESTALCTCGDDEPNDSDCHRKKHSSVGLFDMPNAHQYLEQGHNETVIGISQRLLVHRALCTNDTGHTTATSTQAG